MTTLFMAQQQNEIFNKNLHSVMNSSESGKHTEKEETREPSNWGKERLFSPARDIRNNPGPGEQSLTTGPISQLSMLKFHPYARDRCPGPEVFRHLMPYIPPNVMSAAESKVQGEVTGDCSSAAARFNPFTKAFHGIKPENQKRFEKQKSEEMKCYESKPNKQEKSLDKMASNEEHSRKQAVDHHNKGMRFITINKVFVKM